MSESEKQSFASGGYVLVRNALPAEAMGLYTRATLMQRDSYWMEEPRYQAHGRYADAWGEAILAQLQPLVESITGKSLYPCYSFLRIYRTGSVLPPHRDRSSCEYSVTLQVGHGDTPSWPIYIENYGRGVKMDMQPGDLMVYKGAALKHWREPFTGDYWVQLFLHYVDADGPYAHLRYDGRKSLGAFNIKKDKREMSDPAA